MANKLDMNNLKEPDMDESDPIQQQLLDHSLLDTRQYGSDPDDSISDLSTSSI